MVLLHTLFQRAVAGMCYMKFRKRWIDFGNRKVDRPPDSQAEGAQTSAPTSTPAPTVAPSPAPPSALTPPTSAPTSGSGEVQNDCGLPTPVPSPIAEPPHPLDCETLLKTINAVNDSAKNAANSCRDMCLRFANSAADSGFDSVT